MGKFLLKLKTIKNILILIVLFSGSCQPNFTNFDVDKFEKTFNVESKWVVSTKGEFSLIENVYLISENYLLIRKNYKPPFQLFGKWEMIDLESGERLWQKNGNSINNDNDEITYADNKLFVSNTHKVQAFELLSGKMIWSFDINSVSKIISTTDKVFVCDKSNFYALDNQTGHEIWKISSDEIFTTMYYSQKNDRIILMGNELKIINADDGSIEREIARFCDLYYRNTRILWDDYLICGDLKYNYMKDSFYKIPDVSGKILYQNENVIVFQNDNLEINKFDLISSKELWRQKVYSDTGEALYVVKTVISNTDTLLFYTNNAELKIIDLINGNQLYNYQQNNQVNYEISFNSEFLSRIEIAPNSFLVLIDNEMIVLFVD